MATERDPKIAGFKDTRDVLCSIHATLTQLERRQRRFFPRFLRHNYSLSNDFIA